MAAVVTPVVAVILAADTQYNFTRYDTCIKAAAGSFYAYMWLRLKNRCGRLISVAAVFYFCELFHKYYDITPGVYLNRKLRTNYTILPKQNPLHRLCHELIAPLTWMQVVSAVVSLCKGFRLIFITDSFIKIYTGIKQVRCPNPLIIFVFHSFPELGIGTPAIYRQKRASIYLLS